jgi:hypothetical protein
MSEHWAVRLAASQASAGGRLRLREGVEVLADSDSVWLRGETMDETLRPLLLTLPTNDRFTVQPDGQLVRLGHTVPQGYLPEGAWQPIRTWYLPELRSVGLAGELRGRHPWNLQRASAFQTPNVLVTGWQAWYDYTITAPQARLKGCRFAVNQQRQVVVCSEILPPLSGQRYVERAGVAVAIGWHWHPPLSASEVREWLGSEPAGLVLLNNDGTADVIAAADFVLASRSAARETNLSLASPP